MENQPETQLNGPATIENIGTQTGSATQTINGKRGYLCTGCNRYFFEPDSNCPSCGKPRNGYTPRRTKSSHTLRVVLVVFVILSIVIVTLAFILYVAVDSGCGCGPSANPPKVTFAGSVQIGVANQYQIDIAGVDKSYQIGDFRISLVRNGTTMVIPSQKLTTNVFTATIDLSGSPAGATTLQYKDMNGDGKVSGGDRIIISNAKINSDYEVTLFYKDIGSAGSAIITAT